MSPENEKKWKAFKKVAGKVANDAAVIGKDIAGKAGNEINKAFDPNAAQKANKPEPPKKQGPKSQKFDL